MLRGGAEGAKFAKRSVTVHRRRSVSPKARRPRDRKSQILRVASRHFTLYGYHAVSMHDIAHDVGITARALYRHFDSKQQLLTAAITNALEMVENATTASTEFEQLLPGLATLALDYRGLPILWEREIRALSAEQRRRVRSILQRITATLRTAVRYRRPNLADADAELIAWSILAVFSSSSYHATSIACPDFARALTTIAETVLATPFPSVDERVCSEISAIEPTLLPASRRERLLLAAGSMFDERGYRAVSLHEIGRRVGIAGPSIYKHFGSKADLLVAVLNRGAERLTTQLALVLDTAQEPQQAIDRLLRSYIDLAMTQPELVGVLVTEVDHLPEDKRQLIRQIQREYFAQLGSLLVAYQPHLSADVARITMHAAFTVINDAIRVPSLREVASLQKGLCTISRHILGIDRPAELPSGGHLT